MSLSENELIESISNSGEAGRAPIGVEANVFRSIRDERSLQELRLVRDHPSRTGASGGTPSEERRRRGSLVGRIMGKGLGDKPFGVAGLWPASGLALTAVVALVFFGVREQRRNTHFAERKATISVVVEFVGLETEMTRQLAEIDLEEARMDEAFHELRLAMLEP